MKAQVKAKEEELVVQAEKQSKYYGKYEDRIAQANEEAERQRQRAEEVQYRV
jgi:SpoVK/Ycf46/Vps4 family AAA+-type ATPase